MAKKINIKSLDRTSFKAMNDEFIEKLIENDITSYQLKIIGYYINLARAIGFNEGLEKFKEDQQKKITKTHIIGHNVMGKIIHFFPTITLAMEELNCSRNSLVNALRYGNKYKGFYWEYTDKNDYKL